jgi:CCR4-NOT transcription complex subunit 3
MQQQREITSRPPPHPSHSNAQVHDPDLASIKEKNEAELKKEVKKLQKFRDQVKTW